MEIYNIFRKMPAMDPRRKWKEIPKGVTVQAMHSNNNRLSPAVMHYSQMGYHLVTTRKLPAQIFFMICHR